MSSQSNTSQRGAYIENLETQTNALEMNLQEQQEEMIKKFAVVKDQVTALGQAVEKERAAGESIINEKFGQVSEMEQKLNDKFDQVVLARKETESKLYNLIDDRFNATTQDLYREIKGNFEGFEDSQKAINQQLGPLITEADDVATLTDDLEKHVTKTLHEEVNLLSQTIQNEKKQREETEEAMLQMLKDVVGALKADVENERKTREATEENLLKLLEDTCNKVSAI